MKKPVITTAIGLIGALAFGAAHAVDNPFAMKDLGKGYQVAADDKAKDAKNGDAKTKQTGGKKAKDGKCGEGKCGNSGKK